MATARQPCNQKHYCNGFKERLWNLYVAVYLLRVINSKPEPASPKFPKPPSPLTLIGRCRGYEGNEYLQHYLVIGCLHPLQLILALAEEYNMLQDLVK